MASLAGHFSRNARFFFLRDISSALHTGSLSLACSRAKSTVVQVKSRPLTEESAATNEIRQQYPVDPLDLTFSNTKEAYKSKTTWELMRALLVLKLSSYDFLINNHQKV